MSPMSHKVTQLLLVGGEGNKESPDRLVPLAYDELHRLVRSYMRKWRADQETERRAN